MTSSSVNGGRRKLDPDRLAGLEEERDFLLVSLDDLEVEYEAGDLDEADYQELKDDYTVRAAESMRAIDRFREESVAAQGHKSSRTGNRRALAWLLGLLITAVAAGFLLAQSVGERGVDGQITGSVTESVRDHVLRCQQVGTDPTRVLESLTCFDEVLVRDPRNVEAHTYRGWYVVLASGTAQQSGQDDAALELLASGQASLQQAVEIDPTFPDARAFRAIVFDRLGEAELACAELQVIREGTPPPMIEQLVAPLSDRLAC